MPATALLRTALNSFFMRYRAMRYAIAMPVRLLGGLAGCVAPTPTTTTYVTPATSTTTYTPESRTTVVNSPPGYQPTYQPVYQPTNTIVRTQ
jgi:hypothetical protein